VSAGRSPEDPEASGRLLFAVALAAGALLRLILLGRPDLFAFDEGRWAIGARNILEGGAQVLAPSATPLGEASGTPILYPWVLSWMVRVFGPEEWAVRLPSAFLGLVAAIVVERIVRRGWGQPAGHLAGAFVALFPPLVAASRVATVETALVTLGLAGIIFGLRAFEEDIPWEGALAGTFFGLGFLAKGYAIGLFLIPLLVALAARPRLFSLGRTKRSLAFLLAAFVLVGGSHLLAVFLLQPASFGFHLATAFGASDAAARAAALPTAFSADLVSILRPVFWFLPVTLLGVAFLWRDVGEDEIASGGTGGDRRLAHGLLWGAYVVELVIVVAVAGRYRLSSIPVMPAIATLTGLGATAVVVSARARTSLATQRVAAGAMGALLVLGGIESARRIRHDLLTHRTGARELAEQIAPAVAPLPPRVPAFRAPEPDTIAFHLFRTGLPWDGTETAASLDAEARAGKIRCWAWRDGEAAPAAPSPDAQAWLVAHAREVTDDVNARAGRTTGLRVFVPESPAPAGAASRP
jgi:4-amino-4-deoxy-L-arabinose transferase-like glycosyltransferase